MPHYTAAYQTFESLGHRADLAYEAFCIGKTHHRLKQFAPAEKFLLQSYNINDSLHMQNYQLEASNETVDIGAQGLKPADTWLWDTTRIVSDAYNKWNFYQDFVVLDNATECNTIFWTGFDGNIYGANTCFVAAALPIKTGSVTVETIGARNKLSKDKATLPAAPTKWKEAWMERVLSHLL